MRRCIVAALSLYCVVHSHPARAAAIAHETLTAALADISQPALAFEPSQRTPHVAYVTSGDLRHAWLGPAGWQDEVAVTGVSGGGTNMMGSVDMGILPDGTPIVLYRKSGRLEVSLRLNGTWSAESIAVASGSSTPSLAVNPATGEPEVAWAWRPTNPTAPRQILLARRAGGVWSTLLVDTTSCPVARVALSVGQDGVPRVSYARPRGDENRVQLVLVCATGQTPEGPFSIEPVDSTLYSLKGTIAAALDPVTQQPRVAYLSREPGAPFSMVRYAARTGASTWVRTDVMGSSSDNLSIAVDATGSPFIANTLYTFVGPADRPSEGVGDAPPSVVYIQTGRVFLMNRPSGLGQAAFQVIGYSDDFDASNGPRALASPAAGAVGVAWRTPGQYADAPAAIAYGLSTPFAGVSPGASINRMGPVAPAPVRIGAPVRFELTLWADCDITLELHDVIGRFIASAPQGRLQAGSHTLGWRAAVPRAGMYWLSARGEAVPFAARRLVVIR